MVAALKEHLAADWPLMSPLQRLKAQGWSLRLSTLERAALLLAEADFQRVREAYGIPGSGGVMGAAREEMRRLLHLGQRFLAQAYLHGKASAPLGATKSHGLLTLAWQSRVPIFELLDRIDSQVLEPIHLRTSPRFADVQFHMHVLPTRNVESNHVRAFFALHCDQVFRDMVEEHQEVQNLMVVEVGTHLGGCVLHALTHLPPSTRALAIDAYGPAVAALRRTAEANGLQQQLAVVEKFICLDATRRYAVNLMATGPTLLQPAWREASDSQTGAAECGSLEAVFQQQGVSQVDLLRIHVLGREADALRSGERFFASGQVKQVAATVSQSSVDPGGMALMLYRHGYELRFREFHGADAVAVLQNKMLLPKSTQTLTARRPR